MNDDDRMAALFRAAASDPAPPAAFDHSDVLRASRRVTARRRSALVVGGFALLVVAGVGTAVALPRDQGDAATSSVAAAPEAGRDAAGSAAPPGAPGGDFTGTPLGPGTATCADRQDPALRALGEHLLHEVTEAAEAPVTFECRPGEERGLALQVDDGGAAGTLTVAYLPPGTAVAPAVGAVTAPTASGGTVIVASGPDQQGDPVPFASRLDAVAAFLAPRL